MSTHDVIDTLVAKAATRMICRAQKNNIVPCCYNFTFVGPKLNLLRSHISKYAIPLGRDPLVDLSLAQT